MINSKESLLKAADYMHDSGFKAEDIVYISDTKSLKIKTKEYEYKGRFIQRKTNVIKNEHEFDLGNVEKCNINITEKDKKGYDSMGEDYFNFIKIENANNIVIKAMFHEIRLEISKISGTLKTISF